MTATNQAALDAMEAAQQPTANTSQYEWGRIQCPNWDPGQACSMGGRQGECDHAPCYINRFGAPARRGL